MPKYIIRRLTAAALAMGLACAPDAAYASTSSRVVDTPSGGWYTQGLDDEARLASYGSYWNSNYALFLQLMLWADGYMVDADMDCKFGPHTAAALGNWQNNHGLPTTHEFDFATRQLMEQRLSDYQQSSHGRYIYYSSEVTNRDLVIHEWDDTSSPPRLWDLRNPFNTSEWHHISYDTGYFSLCSRP